MVVLAFVVMYEVSKSTANCDSNLVVSTKDECNDASIQLELNFKHTMDKVERHAGCYKDNEFLYFNTIINPSDTTPSFGEKIDRRAICGTNLIHNGFYIDGRSEYDSSNSIHRVIMIFCFRRMYSILNDGMSQSQF